jgi:hypothetical protein
MTQWAEQRTAATADSRGLTVEQAGDPEGFPVLVHFGTPNSRHLYGPEAADAAGRGLRLICRSWRTASGKCTAGSENTCERSRAHAGGSLFSFQGRRYRL